MEAWWEITVKGKVLGVGVHTEDNLKKKLRHLKLAALNAVQDQKGGRRTAKQLSYLPMVM